MKNRILMFSALCAAVLFIATDFATAKPSFSDAPAGIAQQSAGNSAITVLEDKTAQDGTRTIKAKPYGICPRQINVSVRKDVIVKVEFVGGCPGNTKAVSTLVQGMKVKDAIGKLEGIDCGGKGTSCPDRLSSVLKLFLK